MGRQNRLLIPFLLLVALVAVQPLEAQDESDTEPSVDEDIPLQFQVGYNAYNRGELGEALNRLRRATYSDTSDPRARYWLGKTLFERGRNDSAVRVLRNADTGSRLENWFRRELTYHRLRNDSPTYSFRTDWSYVGLIDGTRYDRKRHVTPAGLASSPDGGWYSVSYEQGRLTRYSEEGKILSVRSGLETPSDVMVHPKLGVLVSELETDRVRRLNGSDTFETFASEGLEAPARLLRIDRSLFVFNSSARSILQFTETGDTVGTVWEAPARVDAVDVAVGPENRFWVLDDASNQLLVVDRTGRRVEQHSYDRNLDLSNLWWRRGNLLAVGRSGIMTLGSPDYTPVHLSAQGDTLPGGDVSDVLFSGDRMVVSAFESSQMLIYRPPEVRDPDLLVRERRMDFGDFPVVRMNVQLNDPLRSQRFKELDDKNFGIEVENLEMVPSLLRPAGDVYGRSWIVVVDNRLSNERIWEEVRPFLEDVITEAPDDSRGSLWKVRGENVVAQGFTDFNTLLENELNRLNFYDPFGSDRSLGNVLHRAYDTLFSLRDPGGVILFSNHLERSPGTLEDVANRSVNTGYPLAVIDPSASELPESHPFVGPPTVDVLNFDDLETKNVWSPYRNALKHHYTAIYRSNLRYQPSSLWRGYELQFYYFDRVARHTSGFLFP